MRLLTEHRSQLNDLSNALLKDDSLDEDRILAVTGITRQVTVGARES
jgi:hypothetical protein